MFSSHVAHNSFIHCFTELGLIGGTLFLGAFLLRAEGDVRSAQPARRDDLEPELRRLLSVPVGGAGRVHDRHLLSVAQLHRADVHDARPGGRLHAPACGASARAALPAWTIRRLASARGLQLAASCWRRMLFVRMFVNWRDEYSEAPGYAQRVSLRACR